MNFRKNFLSVILLCLSVSVFANDKLPKPKLVIGVVVDQMRWDYLYRYYDRYSDNGFKRLLNEGFSCENNYVNYIPTYTAIGHSTIYTGSVPAIHGMAGNNFIDQLTGKEKYCTFDESVQGVGSKGKAGKQSPQNLLVTTVTDQLKLATNFKSKVIGIAMKDRGGILPVGHFADAAYWLDSKTGDWISSTFYMQKLPKWVNKFNKQKLADKYISQGWNTLYPIETYILSTPDNNPYEGTFKGEEAPVFPRDLSKLKKENGYRLITTTPSGNTFTLDLAKAAIENENLGNNPEGVTDFLAVSLSSTDYIGHKYAINSIEIEDTYLRLDKDIADLLNFLDEKVGKGQYTFFLSADHGASHNPLFIEDNRGKAGYFDLDANLNNLNAALEKKFGKKDLAISLLNYQVHLNNALIEAENLDETVIKAEIVKHLRKVDGILFAVDMDLASVASVPERIRERIINGYNYKRSGAVQIILDPQWYEIHGDDKTGTTHGTWGSYDSHIPVVFMGWSINKGKTNRETHMTDIAPTLSAILNIEEPNGNIGIPIFEAIKR